MSPENDPWTFTLSPYDMFDPSDDYRDAEYDAADREARWKDDD